MLIDLHEIAELFSHKRVEGLWVDLGSVSFLRVCKGVESVPHEEHNAEIWGVEVSRMFFVKCRDLENATKFAVRLVELVNEAKMGHYKASAAVGQANARALLDEMRKL